MNLQKFNILIFGRKYFCAINNYMGASQNRRSGTSSGTFHTPVPYLLEGSVLYLCSIPLIHTLLYNYYIYIHLNMCSIYIHLNMCNLILHLYAHTRILERTYTHECVHARIGLLCPSPVIVLSSLCFVV